MRKLRKRDKYLICSIAAIIVFAAAVLLLARGDHTVPDALIYGWFAFWATEIYQIAKITIKGKVGNSNEEIDE